MKNKALWGRIALLSTTIVWGSSFVVMKSALDYIGTLWLIALRFIIAAALMLAIAYKRLKVMPREQVRGAVYLGICLAAAYVLQTYGLYYTTPGKNAFLTTIYCVIVPFLAWMVNDKRLTRGNILAALLCFTGIGLVSLSGLNEKMNIGDVLTILCGFAYAVQMIIMERYCADGDTVAISTVEFIVTAVISLACALIFEPVPRGLNSEAWMSLAFMGVICTALCYFLMAWGIKYTPSTTASVILALEAVFGTLFSVLFYDEKLTVKLAIGFGMIFVSVLISELGSKKQGEH